MKQGATYQLPITLKLEKDYTKAKFTLKSEKETVTKDLTTDTDGVFLIPLKQEDTMKLQGVVKVEVQVNYTDLSVWKNDDYLTFFMKECLANEMVENNAPSNDDGIPLAIDIIKEGLAVVISPESSAQLIEAVREIFEDTKEVADSVREDADNGVFDGADGQDGQDGEDGEDGFSPVITIKKDTDTEFILHIKTADDEFDTENLKGQDGVVVEPEWEQLATVNVGDLSDTPDGFIWDIDDYDDVMIDCTNMASVTGNRNFVMRLNGQGSYIGLFANLINQTPKDIYVEAIRRTGLAIMDVKGHLQNNSYPYTDSADYGKPYSLAEGKINQVEIIIGGGGGLATGTITLYGRKRG